MVINSNSRLRINILSPAGLEVLMSSLWCRFNSVVCTTWQHHSCYTITSLKTDRRQSCSLLSCCLHQPFEYLTTEKIHNRKNPDYCCSLDIFLFFRLVPEWDACVWKSQYILISEIFRPTCSSVTTCLIQNHLNDLSFSFWCSVWTSAGHIGHVYMPGHIELLPCD